MIEIIKANRLIGDQVPKESDEQLIEFAEKVEEENYVMKKRLKRMEDLDTIIEEKYRESIYDDERRKSQLEVLSSLFAAEESSIILPKLKKIDRSGSMINFNSMNKTMSKIDTSIASTRKNSSINAGNLAKKKSILNSKSALNVMVNPIKKRSKSLFGDMPSIKSNKKSNNDSFVTKNSLKDIKNIIEEENNINSTNELNKSLKIMKKHQLKYH